MLAPMRHKYADVLQLFSRKDCARMPAEDWPRVVSGMGFQAPESLSEQIAQYIGRQIILGQLRPLERIQELKLARELSVSRGSVREALLILQARHLVAIYPRRGAVVSDFCAHQAESLYDIYVQLLAMLVCRFAARWTAEDLARFQSRLQQLSHCLGDESGSAEQIMEASFELMRSCYQAVANPYLEEALESYRPALSRAYYLTLQYQRPESASALGFYNRLLEAIQERSQEQVRQLVWEFGRTQLDMVLQAITAEPEVQAREA